MKQNNGLGSVSIFPLPGLSVGETDIEQDASTAPTRIIDSTLVPHTAFAKALKRIRTCFNRANGKVDPHCLLILGQTGTGKSTLMETFYEEHPAVRLGDGLHMPILRVKVPSQPTVKSFVTELLIACHDPFYDKGTASDKTKRLKVLMRGMRTRMIHVDEANHFIDKGRLSLAYAVADWFKVLIDDTKVSVIACGIPIAAGILEQNDQLKRRFLAPILMPRFNWLDETLRDEFIAVLESFHGSLAVQFDLPELHSPQMAFRCYVATRGLVGLLTKLLSLVEEDARVEGRKVITLAHLEDAARSAVGMIAGHDSLPNPFSRKFVPEPTADLLGKIDELGRTAPIATRPRRSKSRAVEPASIQDVF
jgi:hypothetical protein